MKTIENRIKLNNIKKCYTTPRVKIFEIRKCILAGGSLDVEGRNPDGPTGDEDPAKQSTQIIFDDEE